ncbi:MAG: hypothetical protein PVSMB9_06900 [Candidatus Dormibacteria bacterium]
MPLIAAAQLEGAFQQAIHAYKYRPRPGLSGALARPLAEAVRQCRLELAGLTFVPLHPTRARQRGFNQAESLAGELGAALSLPVLRGLERVRPTPAQVGLSGWEREANVSGAFRWVAAARAPGGVGLVDDVCTTGATLRAAAAAIEAAGGSVGAFLVLAVPHTLAAPVVTLPE